MAEEAEWVAEYASRKYVYDAFAAKLQALLVDLLVQHKLEFDHLDSRVKTTDSFAEKVNRKAYENPLLDITDLVGFRVVTYYAEDVEVLGRLLGREFSIHEQQSSDRAGEMEPDRFGYLSAHYVLSLSDPRQGLQEWLSYQDFKFEVQVRTVLQHAWASISHKLDYKAEADVSPAIRRRLFRLSALFEIADSQFSELRTASMRLDQKYRSQLSEGRLADLPVGRSSLIDYLAQNSMTGRIRAAVRAAGFQVIDLEPDRYEADVRDLVRTLGTASVTNIAELDRVLRESDFIEVVRILGEEARWNAKRPEGSMEDALTQVLSVRFINSVIPDAYTPQVRAAIERAREVAVEAGLLSVPPPEG